MNQIVFAAGVLLFPAVCTTLGAAGVFLLRDGGGHHAGGQRVEPAAAGH